MVDFLRRSWAVVDLDCIDYNIRSIKAKLRPGCMIMGVVKADAYGHGDKYIADELVRLGVNWFAVSNLNEAMSLRTQGIYHPILILGTTPPNKAKELCEYNITQAVFSLEYARKLQQQAQHAGVTVACHIKVDTGMGRIGFEAEQDLRQAVEEIAEVCQFPNLRCDGIFTHFSSADEYNEESIAYTRRQYELFMQTCDELQRLGVHFAIRHCCNSGGIVNYPEYHLDMVRAGILIYGLVPDKACEDKIDLKPAMQLHSVISMIKEVKAGAKLSYGRTFTADHDMRIATVPIGYADGLDRHLGCGAWSMRVKGRPAPIVGRVCMDSCMIDVTDIDGVAEGDEAVVFSPAAGNTPEAMAEVLGTIPYEILTSVAGRVKRIYLKE